MHNRHAFDSPTPEPLSDLCSYPEYLPEDAAVLQGISERASKDRHFDFAQGSRAKWQVFAVPLPAYKRHVLTLIQITSTATWPRQLQKTNGISFIAHFKQYPTMCCADGMCNTRELYGSI